MAYEVGASVGPGGHHGHGKIAPTSSGDGHRAHLTWAPPSWQSGHICSASVGAVNRAGLPSSGCATGRNMSPHTARTVPSAATASA